MTSTRPGPQFSDFFGRLRARPLSSWEVSGRVEAARTAVDLLAGIGYAAEHQAGQPVPPVPDLGAAALADQLEVLYRDAVRAGVPDDRLHPVLRELAAAVRVDLR